MILTLTVSGETYELDLASFRLSDSDELMRFTGWSRQEWLNALFEDHPDAIRYTWWLVHKRADQPLQIAFKDIDFDLADLEVDLHDPDAEHYTDGAESEVPTGPSAAQADGESEPTSTPTAPSSDTSSE